MKRWRIGVAKEARKQLEEIGDSRIRKSISKRIDKLEYEPEKQGKPLTDELTGFRSVRAVGQRYRIIYEIEDERVLVLVVMVGIRKQGDKKDVYTQAIRLAQLGLLDLE
jgi:mRNA interferase RelE/StbE